MAEDDGSRMTSVDLCAMIAKGRCSGKLGPEAEGATGAGPFVCAGARPTSSQTHFTLGESGCFITSFLKTTLVGYRFSRQSKRPAGQLLTLPFPSLILSAYMSLASSMVNNGLGNWESPNAAISPTARGRSTTRGFWYVIFESRTWKRKGKEGEVRDRAGRTGRTITHPLPGKAPSSPAFPGSVHNPHTFPPSPLPLLPYIKGKVHEFPPRKVVLSRQFEGLALIILRVLKTSQRSKEGKREGGREARPGESLQDVAFRPIIFLSCTQVRNPSSPPPPPLYVAAFPVPPVSPVFFHADPLFPDSYLDDLYHGVHHVRGVGGLQQCIACIQTVSQIMTKEM